MDWELAKIMTIVTLAVVIMTGGCVFGINLMLKKSCYEICTVMDAECTYSLWTDCMIKADGNMQPFNDYNTVNLQNNIK